MSIKIYQSYSVPVYIELVPTTSTSSTTRANMASHSQGMLQYELQLHTVHVMLISIFVMVGTSNMINKFSLLSSQLDNEDQSAMPACNKDTGGKKQLQRWTRGHLFIVRGGGHIESWQPLYK